MTPTLYGLSPKVCDTVKKALSWLEQQQIAIRFYDYRSDGLPAELLEEWLSLVGWQALLNKRSTSFRELPDAVKQQLDLPHAKALMLANPTLIKRPVLQQGERICIGFSEKSYQEWFGL